MLDLEIVILQMKSGNNQDAMAVLGLEEKLDRCALMVCCLDTEKLYQI